MANAPNITEALTGPFAAGLVVQRALEILDPLFPASIPLSNRKKIYMGLVSLAMGWAIAFSGIRVFAPLDVQMPVVLDCLLSGIFISAGTEGFNSLLKFANYKKAEAKKDAAKDDGAKKDA